MKNDKDTSTLNSLLLMIINLGLLFYYVLLYKLVWNWFIGEYIVFVSYMEMLFISLTLKFIVFDGNNTRNTRVINENFGKPDVYENASSSGAVFIAKTIMFIFLFIIYLIKNNYYG